MCTQKFYGRHLQTVSSCYQEISSKSRNKEWGLHSLFNFFIVRLTGTILRKLPRKVDVLEGENAAFCVEVEKEEMDIHWYKDGTELRETHQTIIKSFGRTHILVFVNTMPQDSGLVIFLVGRSKTSSQLRVKCELHYQ